MSRIATKSGRGSGRLTKAWLILVIIGLALGVTAQIMDRFTPPSEPEQASISLPPAPSKFASIEDHNRSSEIYDVTGLINPDTGKIPVSKQVPSTIQDQRVAVTTGLRPKTSAGSHSGEPDLDLDHTGPKTINLSIEEPTANGSAGTPLSDRPIPQLETAKVIKLETLPETGSASGISKNNPDIIPVFPAPPDAALFRPNRYGPMPQPAADGRRAAQYYARPYKIPVSRAGTSHNAIGLIVGGLGLDKDVTQKAIDALPPNVSLAFAPYARNLTEWAEKARLKGHELLLELPMEHRTQDREALGSAVLSTDQSWPEKQQRLEWLLTRFAGYFAVTNYLGVKLSSDIESIRPILNYIDAAGIAYIDDTGNLQTADITLASGLGTADMLIPPNTENITAQLAQLEALGSRQKRALGKTYATADNIDKIIAWAENIDPDSLALVPASAFTGQAGK